MVRQFYEGMIARVTDNGAVSEAFATTNEMKRVYVLVPTLFSLVFSAMLMDAYRDESPVIHTVYRTNGHLFNSRRRRPSRRLYTTPVHDLLFVDDCERDIVSECDMQIGIYLFDPAYVNFGLAINTDKTFITHQPLPNAAYNDPHIHVESTELKTLHSFAYLGTTLFRCIKVEDEVTRRISKANQSFCRLPNHVWNRHALHLHTKLKVYEAIILLKLLFHAET
nr:unnamed protein product [Spirometra erinaceieuropaei]